MQLNYNILWIDDEIDNFNKAGDVERIHEFLYSLGFIPKLHLSKDGKDIDTLFRDNKFDLIISDFNIEEGHHGDDIIKQIRQKQILTEVLFYSSQSDLTSIAQKLLTVDRISFHSGRRNLIEKIESLISLTISKLLELNATRGLITGHTSELDVIIEDIVMHLVFDRLKLADEELDKIIQEYVDGFLKKSPEKFLEHYKQHKFKKLFHKIEASRKWQIFRDLLKRIDPKEPAIEEFLKNNKTYQNEVIDIRNKFAHARAIEKDGKLYLAGFGPDGVEFRFDADSCAFIRQTLIKHSDQFDELRTNLIDKKATSQA